MGKVILVTGTSTGFGKLMVETLAKDGHHVFAAMRGVNGKNATAAQSLTVWAKETGTKVDVVELDVTSDASVEAAAAEVLAKAGAVDVVVNNAGIYGGGLSEAYSVEDYKTIFEVNVFGSLRVVHAFLPAMRKQKSGLFVQVSSLMGRFVIPFSTAYTSSKWAIEAVAEGLRYELAPLGIDSVIVEPGAFPTEIFQKTYQPAKEAVTSEYAETLPYLKAFDEGFAHMMSGDVPNKPQMVADAVKTLVDTPAGKRPLRVPVDKMMGGVVDPINGVQDKVQASFLGVMQLGGLLQTHNSSSKA